MKNYKIRNASGLYSKGGMSPIWTKKGKTWSGLQYIKSHLTLYLDPSWRHTVIPEDWIVEEWIFEPDKICEMIEWNARDFYENR